MGAFLPRQDLLEAGGEVVDGPGDHQVVVDRPDKRDHQHSETHAYVSNKEITKYSKRHPKSFDDAES